MQKYERGDDNSTSIPRGHETRDTSSRFSMKRVNFIENSRRENESALPLSVLSWVVRFGRMMSWELNGSPASSVRREAS